ncbi:hypothetical protein MCOR08_001238 [Pyricularia oryzae]|nr:hypothetical protein MCOR08_001238 [Pyricularia oryzae]
MATMAITGQQTQKRRPSYDEEDMPMAKRARTDSSPHPVDQSIPDFRKLFQAQENEPAPSNDTKTAAVGDGRLPTMEEQARSGLRRSIALVLKEVGFDSTSEPALERLTEMTEEYLTELTQEVRLFALASRRTQPIPTDYEISLKRFNLGTSLLRPHLRHPIAKKKKRHLLEPKFTTPAAAATDGPLDGLPLLGEELSGKAEKESKSYIPASFPDFPSIHTYKSTPQDVDEVTVRGTGLRLPNGEPVKDTLAPEEPYAGEAPPRADPRRMREASARESKLAEEALRGVVRASKINTLKEARLAAQRSRMSRNRYDFWEESMRDLVEDACGSRKSSEDGGNDGEGFASTALAAPARGSTAARSEIADHSMIVNAHKVGHRQEVSRGGKRAAKDAVTK